METIAIHILKASLLALLFLLTYWIFLRKETLYTSNRIYLLAGVVISALLPFVQLTKTIWVQREPISYGNIVPLETSESLVQEPVFNWGLLLFSIYSIGVFFFLSRILIQLWSMKRLKEVSEVMLEKDIKHVRSKQQLSPFSFFKNIFYCPTQFSRTELHTILIHEKAHARQYHSLDVLFIQFACALLWFNPLIWVFKFYIKQNLEFLADNATLKDVTDKKHYQYLLLKQAIITQQFGITNSFYNSLIKKRIIMLNQNQSKSIHALKLLFILPFLVLFLWSFNSKEEVKFIDVENKTIESNTPIFVSPLHQEDIKRISSGFGRAKNPFSKQMDFHNGIDLVASTGKPVLASADGKVGISAANDKNGNFISIAHQDGFSTKYLHLQHRTVDQGDLVTAGTVIGYVGNTGKTTGPHLHFEILQNNQPVNPSSFIAFAQDKKEVQNNYSKKEKAASAKKSIELVIDKKTSNAQLEEMKNDLAQEEVDFSYTAVRNDSGEIIDIKVEITGKGQNGAVFKNSHNSSDTINGISPLVILIDLENNLVSMGTKGSIVPTMTTIKSEEGNIWISADHGEQKEIIIKEEDGKKKIYINNEEVDPEELEDHRVLILEDDGSDNTFSFHFSDKADKKTKKHKSKKDKKVMFISDEVDDAQVRVIKKNEEFVFIDTDDDEEPLFIIDGKEVNKKAMKKLNTKNIATINVLKDEAAEKKYGDKAKNGVVEIVTKQKK